MRITIITSAVAVALGALTIFTHTAAADPESELGRQIRKELSDNNLLFESSDNDVTVVQTPLVAHWGNKDFDADPRCTTGDVGCDPEFKMKSCTDLGADCGNGTTCGYLRPANKKLCLGHSDTLLNDLYDHITSAKQAVDIVSLYPFNGRYLTALNKALAELARTAKAPLTVRIQYAGITGASFSHLLAAITAGVPTNNNLKVHLGWFMSAWGSWNHAKIVAVDGRRAFVSGNNLVEDHYLNKQPVHDLALDVTGGAARDAHAYVDHMWGKLCGSLGLTSRIRWKSAYHVWSGVDQQITSGTTAACPATATLPPPPVPAAKGTYVLAAPRYGADVAHDQQPSDVAIRSMIAHATHEIDLAQPRMSQDIMVYKLVAASGGFATETLIGLADALLRGVVVKAVFGDPSPNVGDNVMGYGGMSAASFISLMKKVLKWQEHDAAKRQSALCKLYATTIKYSDQDRYRAALHSKFVMADQQVYYVGSHNLYEANLLEFGYVVDGKRPASEMATKYWNKLWTYSASPNATQDASCKSYEDVD